MAWIAAVFFVHCCWPLSQPEQLSPRPRGPRRVCDYLRGPMHNRRAGWMPHSCMTTEAEHAGDEQRRHREHAARQGSAGRAPPTAGCCELDGGGRSASSRRLRGQVGCSAKLIVGPAGEDENAAPPAATHRPLPLVYPVTLSTHSVEIAPRGGCTGGRARPCGFPAHPGRPAARAPVRVPPPATPASTSFARLCSGGVREAEQERLPMLDWWSEAAAGSRRRAGSKDGLHIHGWILRRSSFSSTRIMSIPPTWVAHVQRSFDSIGWSGLKSDAAFGCITPPPFGGQCTLPREAAIAACMAMPGCIAVTCPEPAESHIGTRGITGPVCQLRSSRTPNERGHGMCKPSGCINIALSRIRRPHELHEWRALGGPTAPLRNPALLFVHGDVDDARRLLLPAHVRLYWPLRDTPNVASSTTAAALPQPGRRALFAVDAVPMNATDVQPRYPRPDLWRAERGRAGGSWGHERRGRRNGSRRWL